GCARVRRGVRRGGQRRRGGHRRAARLDPGVPARPVAGVRHGPAPGGDPRARAGGDRAARAEATGAAVSDDRLRADYAAAGFGRRLEPGRRPALLLVDLVRAYFTPGSELYLGDDACLASAARLLAVARRCGVPVVHTRVRYAEGGADGGVFVRKVGALARLVGDSPDGQIMPQVAPQPGEPVVVKQYASAFFGTSLASTLTSLGVDTTVIAGVS